MENGGLSENQRLFCLYYMKYRSQAKAYQKAYQCSYENACACAYKVWKKQEVQTEIKKLLEEVHEDIKIDVKDLIRQQVDIARADVTDFVNIHNGFATIREDMDGTLVREIKNTPTGISLKLYDKQKAIDWLAKNMSTADSGTADDRKLLADVLMESKGNRSIEDFEGDNADEHSGAVQ
jgi:phage terminase small subunit